MAKHVTGGGLLFIPETGERTSLVVNAAVRANGTFAAETIRTADRGSETRPGAPIGRYKVIYHPPGNGSKTGLEVELDQRVMVEAKANTATVTLPLVMPKGSGLPRDDDPDVLKQEAKGDPKTDK